MGRMHEKKNATLPAASSKPAQTATSRSGYAADRVSGSQDVGEGIAVTARVEVRVARGEQAERKSDEKNGCERRVCFRVPVSNVVVVFLWVLPSSRL